MAEGMDKQADLVRNPSWQSSCYGKTLEANASTHPY